MYPDGATCLALTGDEYMIEILARLSRDEEGATAVEYGLIVAAIAGVIAVVVFALGPKVNNQFSRVNSQLP
jgi:pilus assembly protein Flp/PilA